MSIVENIKLLCRVRGISIPKLEKELSFGRGTTYNWDKNSPSIDKVQKVAEYFGVSLNRVLYGTDEHGVNKPDDMEKLTVRIKAWAFERDLDIADPNKQVLKLGEKFGELCQGMEKGKLDQVKDSIGDMYVELTILAMRLKLDIESCVQAAYIEIEDRQ